MKEELYKLILENGNVDESATQVEQLVQVINIATFLIENRHKNDLLELGFDELYNIEILLSESFNDIEKILKNITERLDVV